MIWIIFIIEAGAARDHSVLLELEEISHLVGAHRIQGRLFERVLLLFFEGGAVLRLNRARPLLLEVQPLAFSGVLPVMISNHYIFGGGSGGRFD